MQYLVLHCWLSCVDVRSKLLFIYKETLYDVIVARWVGRRICKEIFMRGSIN
jgi:hypothetical protein